MRAMGLGDVGGVEGLSKEEKGLMDMDNSVVIAGGKRGGRGFNGNGTTIKSKSIKPLV